MPLQASLNDALVYITQFSTFPAKPMAELDDHLDLDTSGSGVIALAAHKAEVGIQMIGQRPYSDTGDGIQYNKRFFHPPSMAAPGADYAES